MGKNSTFNAKNTKSKMQLQQSKYCFAIVKGAEPKQCEIDEAYEMSRKQKRNYSNKKKSRSTPILVRIIVPQINNLTTKRQKKTVKNRTWEPSLHTSLICPQ